MSDAFTTKHRSKLERYLAAHTLPSGLGSEESACSLAAINLAISGELTDNIPECMSEVLGQAAIVLQDASPDEMRNSDRYKRLLPDMVGTGRDHEQERLKILLDWMWAAVLPHGQNLADTHGFGDEWRTMCQNKNSSAAYDAAAVAYDAAVAAHDAAASARVADAYARVAAYVAAHDAAAATATAYAAAASAYAAVTADTACFVAAAAAARDAADAAYIAARFHNDGFWGAVDPIGALEQMTYLQGQDNE